MDSTAYILLFTIIALLLVIVLFTFIPRYEVIYPRRRHHYMPRFGPYWTHGGQIHNRILY